MPLATNLSFVGFGKETTKGTGVVPTLYLPVTQFDPVDNIKQLDDTAMRGSMVDLYDVVQGPSFSGIDFAGPVFPDTFGIPVAGIMGEVATTGAGPYTHAITVKNSGDGQPPAWSVTDFYGLSGGTPARRYAGSQWTDLSLKWQADGLLEWSGKTAGYASGPVAKPTPSFTSVPVVPSWLGTVSIGGAGKTFVEQGSLDLKRTGGPIDTVDGTQNPYAVWVGALSASGKLTMVMEDETELTRYLAATKPALVLSWVNGATTVQATMTKVAYKAAAIKRAKDYVQLEVDYAAIANTTDVGASAGYGQIKWSIINALPSGTYA